MSPHRMPRFFVAAIGSSAGGLEAMIPLLENLSPTCGIAFIILQHRLPDHESQMTQILSRHTKMPVHEAADHMRLEPNHIFLVPSHQTIGLLKGRIQLSAAKESRASVMPIDQLFRALAEDQESGAIGIVLSGTGTDGVLGLQAIKAEGGLTFAQEETSAKFSGMPAAAVAAGGVDFVMPPVAIAQELQRLAKNPPQCATAPDGDAPNEEVPADVAAFTKIFALLRKTSGVDFSYYKHSTIQRRVSRRILLNRLATLNDYVTYLYRHPLEQEALYEDLLIDVTHFFRDPELFTVLQKKIFPEFLKNRPADTPIRIWTPGCSSGEETYSVAIILQEFLAEHSQANIPVQIFGTDVSESSIEKARSGVYSANAVTEVSPERLRRFFVKTDRGYQIRKSIRDSCVFARQNLVKDPPFSHLDLICCRNLLIYLGPILQKRLIPIFHYALRPQGGYLVLGSAETVGTFTDLFQAVDKRQKVFVRKAATGRALHDFHFQYGTLAPAGSPVIERRDFGSASDIQREADRHILNKYVPASVLVNDAGDILLFRGKTSAYIEPAPGHASLNIFKMAREGLQLELRTALNAARRKNVLVRKKNVHLGHDKRGRRISLDVLPIRIPQSSLKERFFLIVFGEAPEWTGQDEKNLKGKDKDSRIVARLRQELQEARDAMQSAIEDQEATNEGLHAANEEIQSTNEELQSTNEELETAKEELQSTNEELTTVNEEMQNRNSELHQVNNDLSNVLSNINMPIIMISQDLRIRRFTSMAEKLLNLIPTDIGRSIMDLNLAVRIPNLKTIVADVVEHLTFHELELQDTQGRWFTVRFRPYKTTENKIDGAVITFIDVDLIHRNMDALKEYSAYAQGIVDTIREPIVLIDEQFLVQKANGAFYAMFKVTPETTLGKRIYELGNSQWDIPALRELLEKIIPGNSSFQDFAVEHTFPVIGHRRMLINARQLHQPEGPGKIMFIAFEDVTTMKVLER